MYKLVLARGPANITVMHTLSSGVDETPTKLILFKKFQQEADIDSQH